ncbi:MAG: hypothetical protein ACRC17_01670, partial [Culicoidibacterales bacterium]
PFLPTITKITTISVGQHALVQQQSIVQDATNSKRYTVTLSATNTSPLELTSTTLAFNLSTNNFALIEANGAVVGANQAETINSTVYNYQNVKWTIGTIPVGETRTVTFIIEAKTGLGIGEQNIYHLTNTSYPILAVQYNGQVSTPNYGYLKAPITWSDSNTATCPIPTIPTPSLTTNKVAVNSATSREYDITLSIDGNETVIPDKQVDIVLLLDRSGSMYTSAAQLNVAVENFLDDVLIDGQTNVRIALTSFGTVGITHTGFTSDKNQLKADLATIPFLENGEVLVTATGYQSVNAENTIYTVSPPFKEGGIDYANITYSGKTYKRLVYTNANGDLVLNLSANTATGEAELPRRGQFFAYTNTEAGLLKVDEVLAQSATTDPCREKYAIIFSDGEPNFYMNGSTITNNTANRVTATQEAKSAYEMLERKYQNLRTYSAGFFTSDSNGLGFDFMSYIQSKVQKPYDYYLNNFTTTADKLEPIFQGIAADLKGNIYYDIAKNIVVRDIVTEQFVLAANPNYRYSGLEPTNLNVEQVACTNSDTDEVLTCDQLTFDYTGQTLTTQGMSITFTVKVRNDYYGNAEVATNVEAKVDKWDDPFTNVPQPPQVFIVPEVAVPFVEGQISVLKDVEGEAIVPESILFDIFLKGSGNVLTGESLPTTVVNNQSLNFVTAENQWQTMKFYLQGSETDTQPNTDTSKPYVTAGTFTVSERVPQNFGLVKIEYCYDNDADITNGCAADGTTTWTALTETIEVSKVTPYVQIKVTNKISNENWWFDQTRIQNNFQLALLKENEAA